MYSTRVKKFRLSIFVILFLIGLSFVFIKVEMAQAQTTDSNASGQSKVGEDCVIDDSNPAPQGSCFIDKLRCAGDNRQGICVPTRENIAIGTWCSKFDHCDEQSREFRYNCNKDLGYCVGVSIGINCSDSAINKDAELGQLAENIPLVRFTRKSERCDRGFICILDDNLAGECTKDISIEHEVCFGCYVGPEAHFVFDLPADFKVKDFGLDYKKYVTATRWELRFLNLASDRFSSIKAGLDEFSKYKKEYLPLKKRCGSYGDLNNVCLGQDRYACLKEHRTDCAPYDDNLPRFKLYDDYADASLISDYKRSIEINLDRGDNVLEYEFLKGPYIFILEREDSTEDIYFSDPVWLPLPWDFSKDVEIEEGTYKLELERFAVQSNNRLDMKFKGVPEFDLSDVRSPETILLYISILGGVLIIFLALIVWGLKSKAQNIQQSNSDSGGDFEVKKKGNKEDLQKDV